MSTATEELPATACRDEAALARYAGEAPGRFGGDENDGSLVVTELSEDEVDGLEMIVSLRKSQTLRRESPIAAVAAESVLRAFHSISR